MLGWCVTTVQRGIYRRHGQCGTVGASKWGRGPRGRPSRCGRPRTRRRPTGNGGPYWRNCTARGKRVRSWGVSTTAGAKGRRADVGLLSPPEGRFASSFTKGMSVADLKFRPLLLSSLSRLMESRRERRAQHHKEADHGHGGNSPVLYWKIEYPMG